MATELVRKLRRTRLKLGKELRRLWMESTSRECEPLTIADLTRGDKFIIMPQPGDNHGHGGLLDSSWLFTKTETIHHPQFPTNCIRLWDGAPVFMSDNKMVIKVD